MGSFVAAARSRAWNTRPQLLLEQPSAVERPVGGLDGGQGAALVQ